MRSCWPKNVTVCSPAISPPRITANPISPDLRAPVIPSRPLSRTASAPLRPSAAARPSARAVPDGASTDCDAFRDFNIPILAKLLGNLTDQLCQQCHADRCIGTIDKRISSAASARICSCSAFKPVVPITIAGRFSGQSPDAGVWLQDG